MIEVARTQTLMWTALPNGFTKPDARGNQKLRLSIFLSPRLETTGPMGTLGDFPDFESFLEDGVNWASTVNAMRFRIETSTMATPGTRRTYDTTRTSALAEPVLWDRFFGPQMPLKQFRFHDLTAAKFTTFGTSNVFAALKQQYVGVAATPSLAYRIPSIAKLIRIPGVVNPPLIDILPTPILQTSAVRALAVGTAVNANPAPVQNTAFAAFEKFHVPWTVPDDFSPPTIPPMDFHRAVSALGNYPALLRRLGFVIDVEVPYTAAMASARKVRVVPVWPDSRAARGDVFAAADGEEVTHRDASQWTAYDLTLTRTLPRRVTKFMTTSRDKQVRDGYLVARSVTNPSADPIKLYNVDVDLAASRLIGTAVNAADIINQQLASRVGAEKVKRGEVTASAVLAAADSEPMGLPALGQPVIRMAVSGMATRVRNQMLRAAAMNAKLVAGIEDQTINYAEDVTRGHRIDVWDSVTRQWHRLCGRIGTYSIAGEPIAWDGKPTLQDEGWVQLGGVTAPEDVHSDEAAPEMRIHESVFDWSGWSLAAPRPGTALSEPDGDGVTTPTKTFTGPDDETHDLGHYLHPDLPLDVRFRVPPGDLPRLRFGTTYRFRGRAVDLAGNSVPFTPGSTTSDPGGSGDSNPLVTRAITHKRYDPVKPPTVVPVAEAKPSESPFVIVVRSYHDPVTGDVITEDAARHITPPRTSVNMAETCGGLEESVLGRPLDPALWTVLCTRDAYDPPQNPDGSAQPQAVIPTPVPYLPDRFSRGAALSGLPGVASTTTLRKFGTSARVSGVRIPLSALSNTTVSTFRVAFEKSGLPWYDRLPFTLKVNGIEGTDARLPVRALPKLPAWNEAQRVVETELPKADEVTVGLSSYLGSGDLQVMGVHQWTMERFVPRLAVPITPAIRAFSASAAAAVAPKQNLVPVAQTPSLSAGANALINASLIGHNWLISPSQDLTLIHPVDQPMIAPAFTSRAHMERKAGETHATLVDWMAIHGKSTVKTEIDAEWTENIDDPSKGAPKWGPTAVKKAASVFNLPIEKNQTRILNVAEALPGSMSAVSWGTVPASGMLVSKAGVDTKPQRHHFGDTKHRRVDYTATFASRFDKYFSDKEGLTFALTSPAKSLHVPSSARPLAPSVQYIVPTFGWTRTAGSSVRKGGGLRVYLDRPWFSSGDDEKLAVVMYQPTSDATALGKVTPFITQWGKDPLWKSGGALPASRPTLSNFKQVSRYGSGLKLREYSGAPVMVAAYDVDYDAEQDRWFADIVVDHGTAYFPFIKLALARYQPYSLSTYELSSVVVADFVQLTPNRTALISVGSDHLTINASVSGESYSGNDAGKLATVTIQFEKLLAGRDADLGWTPMGDEIELARQPRTVFQIVAGLTYTVWAGTNKLSENVEGRSYRAVIREYEWFKSFGSNDPAGRVVYTEAIPLSV